jgi:hypothetical protein
MAMILELVSKEGAMATLWDILENVAIGAALLLGVGLFIGAAPLALELMATR